MDAAGLSLPWSVSFPTFIRRKSLSGTVSSESMELGNIAINPLEHLRLFDIKKDGNQNLKAPGEAYILQDISPHGLVCLMYHSTERQDDLNDSSVYGGSPKTSIYLFAAQDQSWVYLAPDFSSYFRLQLEHLGIKGWQMSRTEAGVPQQTADWLSFYASSSLARPQSIDSDASSLTRLPRTLVSLDKTARLMGLLDRKLTKRS